MTVKVAWCDVSAARMACERWHYSRSISVGRTYSIGVWEHDRFIGAVVFGRGANWQLGNTFDLAPGEYAELTRVALRDHDAPVSQIVPRAVRLVREHSPGLRLLVSFADPVAGHHGGIYQAMNWAYTGLSTPTRAVVLPDGRHLHNRAYTSACFGHERLPLPEGARFELMPAKYRYAFPLDRGMRRRLVRLALPYPSRGSGVDGDPPTVLVGEAGSTPAARS